MKHPELHVCHICGEAPPAIVMRSITRPCMRVPGLSRAPGGPEHTWWVCSTDCAFALGERAGIGSLEWEPATHPPDDSTDAAPGGST